MEINKDLVAASSTPIVLTILAEGDSYGYQALCVHRAFDLLPRYHVARGAI